MYELQFTSHLIDLLLVDPTVRHLLIAPLCLFLHITNIWFYYSTHNKGEKFFWLPLLLSLLSYHCHMSTHTYNPLDTSKGIRFYSMNMVLLCSSYEKPKQIYKKKIYVLEWLTWPRSRFQITRNYSMVMAFFFKVIGGKSHIKTHTIINKQSISPVP